ncbi:LysR family transcriptional regulator [Chitinivorax sp. B]|uniref:LysR family transcriptional regulator n=1 Tax=Chitinivorax sp. B TaxID=2502235 RepID=UPI0010F9D5A2|nr:LysR family transcriptional regulator [Chitinivorax sp. B]
MHMSRVDLNLFVVFETIYTEGTLTKASHKLNLTQPAVSHALARLRDLLKDPLFTRQGMGMVPTPLARNLIGPVRQALQTLEISLHEQAQFDPLHTNRTFTLGLRDVLEATALPPLLMYLQQHAPQIDIASVRVDRRDIESELASGTLDLVVDIPMPVGNDIRQQRISCDRLVVVVNTTHPLIQDELTLDTYLEQPHVLVSSRRKGPGLEDFELNRQGLRRRIALRCQHYFAACRVVSQTHYLLTMPEQYARVTNAQLNNRLLPFPLATPRLDVHLYWHANVDNDPANRWLREQLAELFN